MESIIVEMKLRISEIGSSYWSVMIVIMISYETLIRNTRSKKKMVNDG